MDFHWPFSAKAAPPLRHVIATREESRSVARKRSDVQQQLAEYVATTTVEQRKADAKRYARVLSKMAGRR